MKVWREGGVSIVLKEDRVVDGQEDGIKEDIEERGSGPVFPVNGFFAFIVAFQMQRE